MTEAEQIAWCKANHAAVWWTRQCVKVQVKDFLGAIKGTDLADAIGKIERMREGRKLFPTSKD